MTEYPLPAKFEFLSEVLRKFTFPHGEVAVYDEMIERLTAADLAELATAYERLAADPGGVRELSAWIDSVEAEKREVWDRWLEQESAQKQGQPLPCPPMSEPQTPDPPTAYYLFYVFDLLKRRAPFKSRLVKYSPPLPVLDWTKLPEDLRWLQGPAEKYGNHPSDKRITAQERAELREVVRRLWISKETLEKFQDWTQAYQPTKHPETNLLAGLWDLILKSGEADGKPAWE